MARTVKGRALTEANRVRQLRLAGRAMLQTKIATRELLSVADLNRSAPTWLATTDQIIRQAYVDTATAAEAYLPRFVEAEGGLIVPEFSPQDLDSRALREQLMVNGPINVKQKIAAGLTPTEALAAATPRVMGVVKEFALAGGRDTVIGVRYNGKSGRWRRVTDGLPCAFCAMLAGRGPVYSEETSDFDSHTDCGCTAEQVIGDWDPTALEQKWLESYADAAGQADASGQSRVTPVRKKGKTEDTILARMRRNSPDLFNDGVFTK